MLNLHKARPYLHPLCLHPVCRLFSLLELVKLQASCKKLELLSELMDHSGNYVRTVLPYIVSLLQKGLGQRILLLTHSLSPDPEVSSTVVVWVDVNQFSPSIVLVKKKYC